MRWIRFDSVGGASGDMILAALIGLGADVNILKERLESVFSDKFTLRLEEASSHGLHGRRMTVDLHEEHPHQHEEHGHHHHHEHEHDHDHGTEHHHHHEHRCFADIRDLINASPLEEAIKKDAIGIFRLLADAEGTVHQCPPEEVHFHEVGAADSIIDIVGAAIGFHLLGVEAIEVGPIPVGSGTVRCAHGLIPVPAPAVVELLKLGAFPVASDCEPVEMLTPTGAAILSYWPKATWSGSTKILRSAHAFGHRAMAGRPNLLRATLCQCDGDPTSGGGCAAVFPTEKLSLLQCNLDDISSELTAEAARRLFVLGALDVWITPILMKKGRAGQMLSVLAPPDKKDTLLTAICEQTGTFGVREEVVNRYALDRGFVPVSTRFGEIRVKVGSLFGRRLTASPEFDDCQKASSQSGVPLSEVYEEARLAYRRSERGEA